MTHMVVAIVLPCYNEETTLRDTCKSLSFFPGSRIDIADTVLFIINNNSTDRTLEVAYQIQQEVTAGSVFIGQEKEAGYVPPRRRGNLMVEAFALQNHLSPSNILILQADADTIYDEAYIETMRGTAAAAGANCLVEGLAEFSPSFRAASPEYVALSASIDGQVMTTLSLQRTTELLCTDAVCGYRLSDYLRWGGHLREFRAGGEEIYAETTRLYLRALPEGARKVYSDGALAYPSERKILTSPATEFASAGFPRETSWTPFRDEPLNLEDFKSHRHSSTVLRAIQLRKQHLVALFGILPLHVSRSLHSSQSVDTNSHLARIAAALPQHNPTTLFEQPGLFIEEVLDLVDCRGADLSDILRRQEPESTESVLNSRH